MHCINISICDDEALERDYLSALVHKWAEHNVVLVQIFPYESAESFLFNHEEETVIDILLLDIQMKNLDGIGLARKIRQKNDIMQIIFITGFSDFIAEGYDVSALHYLIKPVNEVKLFEVLDKARKVLTDIEKPLVLNTDGETHCIPLSAIRYIEVQGHYLIIRTIGNNCDATEYKIKMNLSAIQKTLGNGFFRCQRSFIVGLRYVRRITRTAIVLDDMTEIPLSRGLYNAANQAVIHFFP